MWKNQGRAMGTALAALLLLGCLEGGPEGNAHTVGNHHTGERMAAALPAPDLEGLTLERALRKRRSVREFSREPVSLQELSQLLFSAQGITGSLHGKRLRTAPSAGALYPIEVYVFAHAVEGLEPGLYHYDPSGHSLASVKTADMRKVVSEAGLGQASLRDAALVIALTGVPERTTVKYGKRGEGYVMIEAGHIAQNVLLQAVSLGLGAVPVGAFYDDRLNALLEIDGGKENSLYLIAVGRPDLKK